MDSSEDDSETRKVNRRLPFLVLRWCLTLVFPVVSFFALAFLVGLVAVFLASASVTSPISVPSQCKIVSSSVDLRSSKVCELGLFNYKAKHVFYSFEKSKFRCRYDYYWASVFKVEYREVSSGSIRLAFAEAPNEALPLNCRPNFGTAWLNKDKFKVNETYDCRYTYGIPKVSLYDDGLFRCQANDPSAFEMTKRYSILSMEMLKSWFSSAQKSKYWKWEMLAGVVAGFSTSLISITVVVLLQPMISSLARFSPTRLLRRAIHRVSFTRACFLALYVCFISWLVFQYGKRLGLVEIFEVLNG